MGVFPTDVIGLWVSPKGTGTDSVGALGLKQRRRSAVLRPGEALAGEQ